MLNEKYGEYTITVNDGYNGYKLIKHRKTKKGENADYTVGYFSNIASCIERLAELHAMQKPTLAEYIKEYKNTINHFESLIKGQPKEES